MPHRGAHSESHLTVFMHFYFEKVTTATIVGSTLWKWTETGSVRERERERDKCKKVGKMTESWTELQVEADPTFSEERFWKITEAAAVGLVGTNKTFQNNIRLAK